MKNIVKRVKNWVWPTKPEPTPAPQPIPIPSIPKPGPVQLINYLRALAILRNIPVKDLQDKFAKLPKKLILYGTGAVIWIIMTYQFISYIFGWR
jgi:hypothetical protein